MLPTQETGILTVAAIRRPKGEGLTEYVFNEKQQIFTLRQTTKSAEESGKRLKMAFVKSLPVKVLLDTRRALIQRIDTPSPQEIQEFQRLRTLLDEPDRVVPIDVESIDPTTFNIVDYYLKFPTFRLCTRIVPNYNTAKNIFDIAYYFDSGSISS